MEDSSKANLAQILGVAAPTLGGLVGGEALSSLMSDRLPRYSTTQVARLRELLSAPKGLLPVLEVGPGSSTGFYAPYEASKPVMERLRTLLADGDLGHVKDVDTGAKLSPSALGQLVKNPSVRRGVVVIGDEAASAATLAHELGHSTMSQKGVLKALRRANARVGLLSKRPVAALSLQATGLAPVFMDSDNPALMAPAALVGASQVPLLLEEATATRKGLSALKKMVREGSFSQNAYRAARGHLAKAFGTYAAPALGLAAMPALIAMAKKKYE